MLKPLLNPHSLKRAFHAVVCLAPGQNSRPSESVVLASHSVQGHAPEAAPYAKWFSGVSHWFQIYRSKLGGPEDIS